VLYISLMTYRTKHDFLSTEPNLTRIPPFQIMESLEDPNQFSSLLISSQIDVTDGLKSDNEIINATYCRPIKGNVSTVRKFHLSRLGQNKDFDRHEKLVNKLVRNNPESRNLIYSRLGHNVLRSSVICSWPAVSALVTRQEKNTLTHSLYVNNEVGDVIYPLLGEDELGDHLYFARLMGISALSNSH